MDNLKKAVELTNRYAAFFGGRLSNANLHRWLISPKTYSAKIIKKLYPQKKKDQPLVSDMSKLILARKVAKTLSFFPTVLLVAITGSLAINNSKSNDDIDLMIITRQNTLWLTRLFVIPLISLFFKRRTPFSVLHSPLSIRNSVCLNLWLDENAMAVPANKQNLYTAHEVLQAKPLFDRGDTYAKFIAANSWTKKYLANAYKFASSSVSSPKLGEDAPLRRGGEVFAKAVGWLLSALNFISYKIQYSYMKRRITRETITLHSAYFHPRDLSHDLDTYLGV